MSTLRDKVRNILEWIQSRWNVARLMSVTKEGVQDCWIMVVTPILCHLAYVAAKMMQGQVKLILIANGLSDTDVEWLGKRLPGVMILRLVDAFMVPLQNPVSHGMVIDWVARHQEGRAVFVDPDCFVFDASILQWKPEGCDWVLGGPFWTVHPTVKVEVPETFLLHVNLTKVREICNCHEVTCDRSGMPDHPDLRRVIERSGFGVDTYPHHFKSYFDTLQLPFCVGLTQGFKFRCQQGCDGGVYHVMGTSYNHTRMGEDVTSGDFFILNALYLHMRFIERPEFGRFAERFAAVRECIGSADDILRLYPNYCLSGRYQATDELLRKLANSMPEVFC